MTTTEDGENVNSAEIPEFVYESLARSLLPVIQKYYESDEGKRAFAEWKKQKEAADEKFYIMRSGRISMFGSPPAFLRLPIFNFSGQKQ